jgi:PIN domain nuclease of toxin-antitoxin system
MSALLLDTHIWLWYAEGDADRLPPKSVRKLDDARETDGLRILSISVWEIGVQQSKGRIQLSAPLRAWVAQALSPAGINLVNLDADIAAESTLLPGEPHGDPADRFLIAAARTRGFVLVTRDESIIRYGKTGYVRVLEL